MLRSWLRFSQTSSQPRPQYLMFSGSTRAPANPSRQTFTPRRGAPFSPLTYRRARLGLRPPLVLRASARDREADEREH